MNTSRKTLRLPHEQRPFWESSDRHSNLHHLAWGLRDFGNYPTTSQPLHWSYNLILRGSPLLMLPEGPLRLAAGQVLLASPSPGRVLGFRDEPDRYTEILVWLWRQPPSIAELRTLERGYRIFNLSVAARARLQTAHLRCRREVEDPDELTVPLLDAIRVEIDTELARSLFGARMRNDEQLLVDTAERWMQRHLQLRNPITILCNYLEVSRSTLERAFDAVLKTSPSTRYRELRMQAAARRLAGGKVSIKQVAFELGYKHPSDFSRAFKKLRASNRIK